MSNILETESYTPNDNTKSTNKSDIETFVGMIAPFAIKPNTSIWQLCDGKAVPTSSKAYKLGLRNTPNLINRYIMGTNSNTITTINQTIQSHTHSTQPHNHTVNTFYTDIDRDSGKGRCAYYSKGNIDTSYTTVVVNASGSTYTRPNSLAIAYYIKIN